MADYNQGLLFANHVELQRHSPLYNLDPKESWDSELNDIDE